MVDRLQIGGFRSPADIIMALMRHGRNSSRCYLIFILLILPESMEVSYSRPTTMIRTSFLTGSHSQAANCHFCHLSKLHLVPTVVLELLLHVLLKAASQKKPTFTYIKGCNSSLRYKKRDSSVRVGRSMRHNNPFNVFRLSCANSLLPSCQ